MLRPIWFCVSCVHALANNNGNAVIAILVGVACFYLLITVPLGLIAGQIEKKVRVAR